MVELVEVEDESFETKQAGPSDNEDDYYTDTDSEISTDDEDNVPEEESLSDRLLALRDIVPPTTRSYIYNKAEITTSWIKSGLSFSGKTLWVISTSAMLLALPFALAIADEQQIIEMDKEMKMREMGSEMMSSGNTAAAVSSQLTSEAKPAL